MRFPVVIAARSSAFTRHVIERRLLATERLPQRHGTPASGGRVLRLAWMLCLLLCSAVAADQTRPAASEAELRFWLENMVWHHRYSMDEVRDVTGLDEATLTNRLEEFGISEATRPERPPGEILLLPYPGGRHPRIGFLDGAIDPQRDTKLSVFCPWDDHSYVVLDVPEAIWSNLGLTYLAHTHIDTIWTQQGIELRQQEWERRADGSFRMHRRLPNGIEFGTVARVVGDHVELAMWLRNGTSQRLTDLRVQNCVMLRGAEGFDAQTNDNKRLEGDYAVARSDDGRRSVITAWTPLHRNWANAPCPCLHSDPKFPDCDPGETQWLRGWLSFYSGDDLAGELARIDATGWQTRPLQTATGNVVIRVADAATGRLLPCRVHMEDIQERNWHFARSVSPAGSAVVYRKDRGDGLSVEHHTTLSSDPFQFELPPGAYRLRIEHGKEYLPHEQMLHVGEDAVSLTVSLQRFVDMAARGWFSGDVHVHRAMDELPNVVLAEDLNVAFPLNYWVRDSGDSPAASGPPRRPGLNRVDPTHVIWPINTEYEIFTVDRSRHTLGAVFVLNHQSPLTLPAPPVRPVAEAAREQQALLDLDKHSWNWSLMIVPVMDVDLFELTNNHHWRTQFGFPQWTLENAPPDWPEIERTEAGFTEHGWTEFGLQTYYALLNCGLRMRVSGGTASGVHPVPLGYGRVYVHTGSDFDYRRWIAGLDAGHSFVTNGPLMDVRFNGELPGTTWTSGSPRTMVRVTGQIDSVRPLRTVEIVRNGEIVGTVEPQSQQTPTGSHRTRLDETLTLDGSGWIAVRCFEDALFGKSVFAHTNPVFVDVPDRPLVPRVRDARFFVRRMEDEIRRNTGVLSDASVAEYRRALSFYSDVLRRAQSSGQD